MQAENQPNRQEVRKKVQKKAVFTFCETASLF